MGHIPDSIRDDIVEYVLNGIPPGDFVRAVLENNFVEACGRADNINGANLRAIAKYCYMEIPMKSWGSPERVKAWIRARTVEYKAKLEANKKELQGRE